MNETRKADQANRRLMKYLSINKQCTDNFVWIVWIELVTIVN